ncbi:MAG: radical SAM protein [Desulfuromonadaceae bacterium]|nr:radical SAM protein [Desulfuromonadaceae bacterium]
MEKILFIVPPNNKLDDIINPPANVRAIIKKGGNYGSLLTDMPLGVLSLSAYLKKESNVSTCLIDFNVLLNKLEDYDFKNFSEYFSRVFISSDIVNFSPTIIGVSTLFTSSYQNVLDISRCCHKIFPNAVLVAGGGVATNMYREFSMDSSAFDALCFGEGEKPLLGLVTADDKYRYLEDDPSWITQAKIDAGYAFKHNFIQDLDEIPFLDYSILNTEDYGINPAITAYAGVGEKKLNFHVMTSRGCPHLCSFCSSHTVHGRAMRYYSIKRIREDFVRLVKEYHAKIFVFQDDHFLSNKQRALDIIMIVKKLQVITVFQNGLALYALDKEMLVALKSAGIGQLLLSVESGSKRVLREIMRKPLNLDIARKVADDCRELGIYTNVNILIGLPGETKEDIEDARVFLNTINANWYLIFCATPLVGSEMFDISVRKKYIKGNYKDCDYKKAIIETEDFTSEYIQEKAYELNLELNFVMNSDMRLGDYETALRGFENAIRAKSDHAFAYYYASKCHVKLGNMEKATEYLNIARTIISGDPYWSDHMNKFNIILSE